MDKKPSKDGDSIPAQLLPQSARVLHVQDLPCHQEDDPKWKVPVGRVRVRLALSGTLWVTSGTHLGHIWVTSFSALIVESLTE